jgi:hypothetical protein
MPVLNTSSHMLMDLIRFIRANDVFEPINIYSHRRLLIRIISNNGHNVIVTFYRMDRTIYETRTITNLHNLITYINGYFSILRTPITLVKSGNIRLYRNNILQPSNNVNRPRQLGPHAPQGDENDENTRFGNNRLRKLRKDLKTLMKRCS